LASSPKVDEQVVELSPEEGELGHNMHDHTILGGIGASSLGGMSLSTNASS